MEAVGKETTGRNFKTLRIRCTQTRAQCTVSCASLIDMRMPGKRKTTGRKASERKSEARCRLSEIRAEGKGLRAED